MNGFIDFLVTSPWGWASIAHVSGWVAFQPYIVRGWERETVVNCPEGNSLEHCKKFHPLTCRHTNGLSQNISGESMWWGTTLAFLWEIVGIAVFFSKRANKPDAVQLEALAVIDEQSIAKLKEYERRMADPTLALAAGGSKPEIEDEVIDGEIVDEKRLRDIHQVVRMHEKKKETNYYHKVPYWMEEGEV